MLHSKEKIQLPSSAKALIEKLKAAGNTEIAEHSQKYFKTGKGEYGFGDKFLGIKVPVVREIAKAFIDLEPKEMDTVLASPFHEVRLAGLAILVLKFKKTKNSKSQKELFQDYLRFLAAGRVNNWDLVDVSAPYLGKYLVDNQAEQKLLKRLAKSKNLWEQRASIMFTFAFIREGKEQLVFEHTKSFLNHPHDLIHKAAGWMLREAGKKDLAGLRKFLQEHASIMPRVMLRYSIEKLPPAERAKWLAKR